MNMQYFKTLIPHDENLLKRVMYGENLDSEEGAEKLLGRHRTLSLLCPIAPCPLNMNTVPVVDWVIGAAFFCSPGFMHHDIREPATRSYMPQLFHARCPGALSYA
jgi:hypothetical protein